MSYESIVGFSDLPKPVIVYGAIISRACFFFILEKYTPVYLIQKLQTL